MNTRYHYCWVRTVAQEVMVMKPQDSQNDKVMATITEHPLGSKYYVLSTSFFNKEKAPYFPGLIIRITLIVGKDT